MSKVLKNLIQLFLILSCIALINCKRGHKHLEGVSQFLSSNETFPQAVNNIGEDAYSNSYQTIKFGEKIVIVYESSEVKYDNGTVTTRLFLDNGIGLNINSEPKIIDEMEIYTISGTFEFGAPDPFIYTLEFEADPSNFKVVKYERRPQLVSRTNAKYLAALAGRR